MVWGVGRWDLGPLVMWVQPEGEVVRVRFEGGVLGFEGLVMVG